MQKPTLEHALIFLLPILGGFGPTLSIINVAGFSLFAFRALVILLYILIGMRIYKKFSISSRNNILYFFLCFWLMSATFLALVNSSVLAVGGLLELYFGVATTLLVVFILRSPNDFYAFRAGWLSGAVVFCAIGYVELISEWHFPSAWYDGKPDYIKPYIVMATFGNPNNFGAYLVLAIAFLLSSSMKHGLFSWSLVALFTTFVVIADNRIGLIGVLAMILFRAVKSPFSVTLLVLLSAAVLFNIEVIIEMLDFPQIQSLTSLRRLEAAQCTSISIRIFMGYVAFLNLSESFGFGVGPGNFGNVIDAMQLDNRACGIRDPHNWFFQIIGEYGILIFVGYVSILTQLFFSSTSSTSVATKSDISFTVLLIAFVFASAANSTFSGPSMNWLFLGVLIFISSPEKESKTTGKR